MGYKIILKQNLLFPFEVKKIIGRIKINRGTETSCVACTIKKKKNGLYEIVQKKNLFRTEPPAILLANEEELNAINTISVGWNIIGVRCDNGTEKNIYVETVHDVFFSILKDKTNYMIQNTEHPLFEEDETDYINEKDKVIMFNHNGEEKNEDKFKHKYIKGMPEEEFYLDQITQKEYDPDESFSVYYYYKEYMLKPEDIND